jgi:hypothetical protein
MNRVYLKNTRYGTTIRVPFVGFAYPIRFLLTYSSFRL